MTNRIKSSLAIGLVALTVVALAPLAMAQDGQMRRRGPGPGVGGPPPGGPGPMGRMRGGPMVPGLRGLDLTEAQQGQVKSIMESHQNEFRAAGEKIGAAREAMRTLLEAETIDESAIRAKSADVAAAEADIAILNAKVRSEIFAILTPEQLQKAKDLQPKRRGP
jgi:protein CpxP